MTLPSIGSSRLSNFRLYAGSLALAVSLVLVLCLFFNSYWHSNDDVGMSMIANGRVIAVESSPNILFSNVLWGHIVRAVPQINGIPGYSIATLAVPAISGAAVILGLIRLGVNPVICISLLAFILVRPVLFPQFTINAGLLMVGAIVSWRFYETHNDRGALVAGCLLAFLSSLVRCPEFLLLLFVGLPLLPWSALRLRRDAKVALIVLICAIAVSAVIDRDAYTGDEWKSYNEFNPARAAFTDYGAADRLKRQPEILARHGYSPNDVDLLGQWFFADSELANPRAMQAMLDELGPLDTRQNILANAWFGLRTFWDPMLFVPVLTALFSALVRPRWQVVACWGLCAAAVCILGMLGRPGVLHVYIPLVYLLLAAPYVGGRFSVRRNTMSAVILLVAVMINSAQVFHESEKTQTVADQVRKDLAGFPDTPVVVWGAAFPYQLVYPVLGASPQEMSWLHFGLGSSTLAPFTYANAELKAGHGMKALLTREEGIGIIADPDRRHFILLERYCKERLHGQLQELFKKKYGEVVVRQCRCDPTHLKTAESGGSKETAKEK